MDERRYYIAEIRLICGVVSIETALGFENLLHWIIYQTKSRDDVDTCIVRRNDPVTEPFHKWQAQEEEAYQRRQGKP